MPPIFKRLATIVVWILFVVGCIGVIHFYVNAAMGQTMTACMALTIASLSLRVRDEAEADAGIGGNNTEEV